jgi:lysozyme family protein
MRLGGFIRLLALWFSQTLERLARLFGSASKRRGGSQNLTQESTPTAKTLTPSIPKSETLNSKGPQTMRFEVAVKHVLKFEGGYVDDPLDPGGETKFGISKRAYPDLDIKNLTKQEAREIYRRDYWDKVSCDELPAKLRLIVFDAAVNHGVQWAARNLQSLTDVKIDGHVGPVTLEAVNKLDVRKALARYAVKRQDFYWQNRMFFRFGKGWITRLLTVVVESDFS